MYRPEPPAPRRALLRGATGFAGATLRAGVATLAALMVLAAAHSPAAAEPSGGGVTGVSEAAAPRATLEAVLPGSQQALLRDRATGDYQLVRVGDSFLGYRISGLQGDQIVLTAAAGTHFVLPLAAAAPAVPVAAAAPAVPITAVPMGAADQPLDPYADDALPPDPYADAAPAVVSAPPVVAPAAPAPVAPAVPAAPRSETVTMARAELHAALADFPARSREAVLAAEPGRGIRLRDVARGSIFDRLGLRSGDLVRTVAGTRVVSVDDAARVYARVLAADSFVVEVERTGASVELRVQLTRPAR